MLTRLDHLVIMVRELDRAVRDYGNLGFTVTLGGEYADGLTRNALIPFRDGSYLELVAFLDPDDRWDNAWGWRPFLSSGGGLIDYCAASERTCGGLRSWASAWTVPLTVCDGYRMARTSDGASPVSDRMAGCCPS